MPKEAKKKQDTKKQNRDSKNFMKEFKAELKRVIWLTPKQLLNNTVAVITVVLITAAIVFVLDFVFESMNKYGLDKLKQIVDNTNVVETNSINDNSVDNNAEAGNETADKSANETENTASEDSNSVE